MEPDLDKLASIKIRQAELRPTPWNKDTVWQNVMSETRRTHRNYYFHYGAAAAVLLLLLFGVREIQIDKEPQLTDVNGNTQQQSSEPQKDAVVAGVIENDKSDKTGPRTDNNKIASIVKIQKRVSNKTSVKGDQQFVQPMVDTLVADLQINEEEFLLPEEETLQEQKVRPIVGVITESYSGDVAKAKRKKSLHKLESPLPVPWENVPNGLVFARKK